MEPELSLSNFSKHALSFARGSPSSLGLGLGSDGAVFLCPGSTTLPERRESAAVRRPGVDTEKSAFGDRVPPRGLPSSFPSEKLPSLNRAESGMESDATTNKVEGNQRQYNTNTTTSPLREIANLFVSSCIRCCDWSAQALMSIFSSEQHFLSGLKPNRLFFFE